MSTAARVARGIDPAPQVYDVVQIDPTTPGIGGGFAVVTAVHSWGIEVGIHLSNTHTAKARLRHGQYAVVGGPVEWWNS